MPRYRPLVLLAVLAPFAGAAACFSSSSSPAPSQTGAPQPDGGPSVDSGSPVDTGAPSDAPSEAAPAPDAGEDSTAPISDAGADALVEAAVTHQSLSALEFDGVDDWVHVPGPDGGAGVTAFSVELWFRTTNANGSMFEVYSTGGGADRFLCMLDGNVCFYVFDSSAEETCTTSGAYADGAWHHAAGTLGSTGGLNLYVDGKFANTIPTTTSSSFTSDTDYRLGYGHTSFESALVYLQGDLDEVRVWSVERSAADIAANYQQEISPSTAGLQAYWKLEETGDAGTAVDSTGNGNDGQLMNFSFTPSPWISPGAF